MHTDAQAIARLRAIAELSLAEGDELGMWVYLFHAELLATGDA